MDMEVTDIIEKMDLVVPKEEGRSNRMDRGVTPALILMTQY